MNVLQVFQVSAKYQQDAEVDIWFSHYDNKNPTGIQNS
jgi:hypothetical protein